MQANAAFWVITNIIFSVCIVTANKWAFVSGFSCPLLLTSLHFLFTFGTLSLLANVWEVFEVPNVNRRELWIPAFVTAMSVAFQNLSLTVNTLQFYQATKLAIVPTVVLLQFLMYRKTISLPVAGSLALILGGVGYSSSLSIETTIGGAYVALGAVISTSMQQLTVNHRCGQLGVSSVQMLYLISPVVVIMLVGFGWLTGEVYSLSSADNALRSSYLALLLSCICAVGVNSSSFFLVTHVSPLTYNVTGHLKTCLVFVVSYVMFDSSQEGSLLGVMIAMTGIVWYSQLRSSVNVTTQSKAAVVSSNVDSTTDSSTSV